MTNRFVLRTNSGGIRRLLLGAQAQVVVSNAASKIAAQAGADAELDEYQTDRRVAAVKVPAEQQARDGALSRAASAAGISIRTR